MRNKPKFSEHKPNEKRQITKAKRGFGLKAIPEGTTVAEWCQKHDPLFHVKGIERYRRTHEKNNN